jgi:hypothetical protein
MSVPAAMASMGASINPIDVLMTSVNSNPYFIGIMMLLLNLGGRYLSLDISPEQQKFLSQPTVRRFFLFAVLFVATRNIMIAAGLTIIVILIMGYLFNENSDLCLWRSCLTPAIKIKEEATGGLTQEEATLLKQLQDKQAKPKQEEQKEVLSAYDIYANRLTSIQ